MNFCGEGRPALGAYAFGLLSAADELIVERHAAGCEECFKKLAGFFRLRNAIRDLPPEAFLEGSPDDE
jgi:RNA polymerase sigma-70 factor (ECF subfamily)